MKWIVLIYLVMYTTSEPSETKVTQLEFTAKSFDECIDAESQINNIVKYGHDSKISYVRSLYWVHSNLLKEIRAVCTYAEPTSKMHQKNDKEYCMGDSRN